MITLYKHQTEALNATADMNRVAYYHDMGLGKTFTGSEKLYHLGARVNLVICQKSKIDDWIEHFREHYDYKVYDLTKGKAFDEFLGLAVGERFSVVGVINYDLIWRRSAISDLRDFTLLLDESSLIQNEQAKRSRFILKKLHPLNVILLSGTPTGGKYELLWSQLRLLGWDIKKDIYYQMFIKYHFEDFGGFPVMIIDGYKNVERLKKRMRDYGCHFLKSYEVIDLPDKIFNSINIPQSKEYKKFRKDKVVIINEVEMLGDNSLTKMLYERQLCAQYSNEKLEAFKDLIDSTEDRLIVFYNFTSELCALKELVGNRPVSIVNGHIKDLKNYENKSNSITFIQYQAGAMGLNLQKANKIIYFSPPLSSELYEQSKKRINRIGQYRTCYYYRLIVKNSIEERIYDTLALRRNYTNELFKMEEAEKC